MSKWWLVLLIPFYLFGEELVWEKEEREFQVAIKLSDSQAQLYEPIFMTVALTYLDEYRVDSQALIQPLLWPINPLQPDFNIVNQDIQSSEINGKQKQTIHLSIVPLTTNPLYLSIFNVNFQPIDNKKSPSEIRTPVFKIPVSSVERGEHQTFSTAPLLPMTRFPMGLTLSNQHRQNDSQLLAQEANRNQRIIDRHHFPWLTVLLTLALSGLWFVGRRLKALYEEKQVAPAPSAKQKALERLHNLQQADLINQNLYENYYVELTNIVRQFIEEKYKQPATAQTTEEFLQEMAEHSNFEPQIKYLLTQFLEYADKVKFARHQPSSEDAEKAYKSAERIIEP